MLLHGNSNVQKLLSMFLHICMCECVYVCVCVCKRKMTMNHNIMLARMTFTNYTFFNFRINLLPTSQLKDGENFYKSPNEKVHVYHLRH